MNKEKINIQHQTGETRINVRNAAIGLGAAAVVGLTAKFGFGAEAAPTPELPERADPGLEFTIPQDGNVQDSAFEVLAQQRPDERITVDQEGQIIASSKQVVKINGIPQPGDKFTLNIGEYDGKPGVDYKVTPRGVSPETEEK